MAEKNGLVSEEVLTLEEQREEYVESLERRIIALEMINEEVTVSLRQSVDLLRTLKDAVPNPEEWKKILESFDSVLHAAKVVRENRDYMRIVMEFKE